MHRRNILNLVRVHVFLFSVLTYYILLCYLNDSCRYSQFEFIEENFKEISSAQLHHMNLSIVRHPVGIDTCVNDVMNRCLDIKSNDVRIVGIFGLPGVGKTTIAKVIFNTIHCCFYGDRKSVV